MGAGLTFTWWGERLPYFDHPYNTTRLNERAVEIACARHFLANRTGVGLEVGNVLGHYGITGHRVIDRHEPGEGVENIDLFDVEGSYDWIVSVSTIEHVHWDDDKDPLAAAMALNHLLALLAPGGVLFVTAPTGWNPHLDDLLASDPHRSQRMCTFTRHGDDWHQDPRPTLSTYGNSTPWADTVWIAEYQCPSTPPT